MGIPVGSRLDFMQEPGLCYTVADGRYVEYEGSVYSLYGLSRKFLGISYSPSRPCWKYRERVFDDIYEEAYPIV